MADVSIRIKVTLANRRAVIHRTPTAIETVGDCSHVWRFIIPANSKTHILEELAVLAINQLSLFPELTSVANLAKGVIV